MAEREPKVNHYIYAKNILFLFFAWLLYGYVFGPYLNMMIQAGPDFKSCFVEASLAFCIKCNFLSAPLHRIYAIIQIIKSLD